MNEKSSQRKQECGISPSIVPSLCSTTVYSYSPATRGTDEDLAWPSSRVDKDSLAARPTVGSTIEVVLPADEPVVIGRPQIKFATSRQISFTRLRPRFTLSVPGFSTSPNKTEFLSPSIQTTQNEDNNTSRSGNC